MLTKAKNLTFFFRTSRLYILKSMTEAETVEEAIKILQLPQAKKNLEEAVDTFLLSYPKNLEGKNAPFELSHILIEAIQAMLENDIPFTWNNLRTFYKIVPHWLPTHWLLTQQLSEKLGTPVPEKIRNF